MTDAIDHGKIVLGAILAGRVDLLSDAQRHLSPDHFTDSVQVSLFRMCERYADQAGGVLSRAALTDILRSSAPGSLLKYEEYYDLLTSVKSADDEFRWSVQQLRELYAERRTGEVLARSMEVLTRGIVEGTGTRQRELRGHADARSFLMSGLSDIEKELLAESSPEGDMRSEERQITEEYTNRRKQRESGASVATGIGPLDAKLGGGQQRGELNLIAGYTSSGKTSLCGQFAWHAVTQQRKNVVIFTSETLRSQVRLKILSRHSRLEKFGIADTRTGRPGINVRDLKAGTLSHHRECALACSPAVCGVCAFREVLRDFSSDPRYGRCYIAQVPRRATVATVEARLARLAREWTADLVIIDYLALLSTEVRHRDLREQLVEIIKEAKQVAVTYQSGLGVPVMSPWQVSREARDKAAKDSSKYSLAALSETAEASNTADVIVSLLEPVNDESGGRKVNLEMQVLKNRDGERGGETINLTADYATSHFSASGSSFAEPLNFDRDGDFR